MSTDERYLVLTALGPDRPGLVQDISRAVEAAGANLQDSRMAILGGEFAILLLVAGSPSVIETLSKEASALGDRLKLRVFIKETESQAAPGRFLLYRLRVSGVDRPGIVSHVTRSFAGHAVNVASLESRVVYAPLSGTPMFVLSADLQVPGTVVVRDLRRDIAAVCDEDNLDFVLELG
jgi:glycine cleavage system transcriptional repressor